MRTVKKKQTKKTEIKAHRPDFGILIFAIIMAIFGAIMIFDASIFKATALHDDQFYFLKLQIAWLVIGLIPATIIYFWDYRKIAKLATPALILNIILLIAVLVVGNAINGSKRWFAIGPIPIQPAEFVKPLSIIFFAGLFANFSSGKLKFKDRKQEFIIQLGVFIGILGIVLLLVLLEPDLGTTMIIGSTAFIMFYISGRDAFHTIGTSLLGVVFLFLAIIAGIVERYRLRRITTFIHLLLKGEVDNPKGDGYQAQQILIGIGSAPIFGKGFGQSRQRFGFLVENTAFTDSIFAVLVEEFGLIGGAILVASWIFFLIRGLKIARRAPDKLGEYMAAGITIWLTLQALLNMGANVGLIPLTGIPLPFLTYGGSNTIVTMIGIALLLNISKFTVNKNSGSR